MPPELIVWDFDGVLNRNIVDGRFVWADNLEADLGLRLERLHAYFFASGRMRGIVRGEEDLRDVASEWLVSEGSAMTPAAFLAYWFAQDARPDDEIVAHVKAHPARHVIGTNNETRRASYIEDEMGFGHLVEHVFASGRMGIAKPEPAYFETITELSGIAPEKTLLVDDSQQNVAAARALGWRAFHFTEASRADLPGAL